jgi:nucleoside-diphosphate-sugar epimerase
MMEQNRHMSLKDKLSTLKNKKILVTGGCGFIGSEVTKQLSNIGSKVTILDNLSSGKEEYIRNISGVELIKSDLSEISSLNSILDDKDYVINLASLPFIPDSYHMPMKFFESNVNSTISLALEVIKHKNIKKFIHISSSEIYGSARYVPMDENHPTLPQSTYAVSKLAAERVVFTMYKEHGLPAVIIRPFNAFGPNITQPYIIPEIISQLLKNDKKISLGNINSKRDLTFVSDTANAIILALTAEGVMGETINVGSQRSVSIKELVSMISEIMEKEVEIEIDVSRMRPFDVDTLVCNYDRANRLLDWTPQVSIMDGLKKTVDWVMEQGVSFNAPFRGWTKELPKK